MTRLRKKATDERSGYGMHIDKYDDFLDQAADEIERLRADRKELLQIARLFADEGMCRMYDEFGTCIHIDGVCDWHDAEHLWESFCMSRGI